MKAKTKLLLFITALGLAGFFASRLACAENWSSAGLADPSRTTEVMWVFNDDEVAHSSGTVVVFAPGAHTGQTGITVTTTSVLNNAMVAGVVPSSTTLAARDYGWVQTYGYHPAVQFRGSSVNYGFSLVTSTEAKYATPFTVGMATGTVGANLNEARYEGVFAIALATATSGSVVPAFIRR